MSRKKKIPRKLRIEVLTEAGHQCAVCGNASDVEVAHIIAEKRGGKLEVGNLMALCPTHHTKYDREWDSTRPNALNTKAMMGYKARVLEKSRDAILERLKKLEEDKTGRHSEQWLTNRVDSLEAENAELKAQLASKEHGSQEWQVVKSAMNRKWKAAELFTSGMKAHEKAHYQAALRDWEASLELDPTWEVIGNLGVVYDDLRRYDDALAAYDKAERLRKEQGLPKDAGLAVNRGVVYQELERYTEALAEFDTAERLRKEQDLPEDADLVLNRGAVYGDLGRYEDALAAYDTAERLRREQGLPEGWQLAGNRGVVYDDLGRYEDALAAYDTAERLRSEQGLPKSWQLAGNRGVVYMYQGHYENALAAYDLSERLRKQQSLPDHHLLAVNRGTTYCKLKQFDVAEKYYAEAEEMRRELGLPVEPMITYSRGQVLFDQGDTAGACELARKARDMYAGTQMVVRKEIRKFLAEHCGEDGNGKG